MTQDTHTPGELLAMDDDEARETLTVDQYERREKLQELHAEADEQREAWAEQTETVEEIAVHADPEAMGTRVDVYDNELLVRATIDNREFRQAAQALDEKYSEMDVELSDLDDETLAEMGNHLETMLSAVLLRWNGHDWPALPDERKNAVLADARSKWGVYGLLEAWFEIAAAMSDEREELMDVVDSFRGAPGE